MTSNIVAEQLAQWAQSVPKATTKPAGKVPVRADNAAVLRALKILIGEKGHTLKSATDMVITHLKLDPAPAPKSKGWWRYYSLARRAARQLAANDKLTDAAVSDAGKQK